MNQTLVARLVLSVSLLAISAFCGNITQRNSNELSHIDIFARGGKTVGSKYEEYIIGKSEVSDSNFIREFIKYRKWKDCPDCRCVRNIRILLIWKDNIVDSLEGVVWKGNFMIEYFENNNQFTKSIPWKLGNYIEKTINEIKTRENYHKPIN